MAILPNAIDLTTVQAVKDWVGGFSPSNNSDDGNIQSCITSASNYWLWRTGMGNADGSFPTVSPFVQPVAYSEVYDGDGSNRQFTRVRPIQSVQSVKVFRSVILQSPDGVSPGWVIDGTKKCVTIVGYNGRNFAGRGPYGVFQNSFGGLFPTFSGFGGEFSFAQGVQNVAISYVAGFPTMQVVNELQTIPASAPFTITAKQGPWVENTSVVFFVGGATLTPVVLSPAGGQYFLLGGGQYLFSAADAGKQVLLSYQLAGTPPDIQDKVRQQVAVNYKRKEWIDHQSISMGQNAGSTTFRSWKIPPEVEECIQNYMRRAPIF